MQTLAKRAFQWGFYFGLPFMICLLAGRQAVGEATGAAFDHSHAPFTKVLKSVVVYKGAGAEVQARKSSTPNSKKIRRSWSSNCEI
jgi:hypothetical protein